MAKPTENLNFAESAPAANISEPTTKRAQGYNFREPLPHNEMNWLLRALMRASRWVLGLFDSDGWLTMGSQYGRLRVTSDTAALHEITHEDVGGFLTRSAADLTRGGVALEVGLYGQLQRTEDDGDLSQITHVNNEGGAGRLEAQLRSGSLAPLDAAPAAGSALKRTEALFLGNLEKLRGQVTITWDGSGDPSITSSDGFNVSGAALATPSGGFPNEVRIDQVDDFVFASQQVSLSHNSAAASTQAFIPYIRRTVNAGQRLRVALLWWNGTNWVDALAGSLSPLAGSVVQINVSAA